MYKVQLHNIYIYSKLSVLVFFFNRLFFSNKFPINFIFTISDYLLCFTRFNKKFLDMENSINSNLSLSKISKL